MKLAPHFIGQAFNERGKHFIGGHFTGQVSNQKSRRPICGHSCLDTEPVAFMLNSDMFLLPGTAGMTQRFLL
jgi:hypothetical protein